MAQSRSIEVVILMEDPFYPLVGEEVTLTLFDESCITREYLEWLRDEEVVRFSGQRFRRHSKRSSLEYLSSFDGTDNLFLAIRKRKSGRMIGTMTVYISLHNGTADIGILVGDKSQWGKGLGLDAWSVAMEYLLNKRALRKVTGGTVRCNVGMMKLFERSGMNLEAVKYKQQIIDGREEDELYFAKFRY